MKLNFTLTSNQGVINFTMDELEEITIQEIKKKIVGESFKFDKIKLFQGGHLLKNEDVISTLSSQTILVFPTINSLRPIIVNRFSQKKEDDEDVEENTTEEEEENPTKEENPTEEEETTTKEEENPTEDVEEKTTKEELVNVEELNQENLKTIERFNQPIFRKLLHLYLTENSDFIEFLKYLSRGNIKTSSSNSYEPSKELIRQIKDTFSSFNDIPNDKIISELQRMHGNLNLLITHRLSDF
jgi:flagellar biosynthesis GTPase FlhF